MKTAILLVCLFVGVIYAAPFGKPTIRIRPSSGYNFSRDPPSLGRTWINCSNPIQAGGYMTKVSYSPDPPQRGQPLKYDFSFVLANQVTGGKTHLTVSWNNIQYVDITVDLCTEVTCPIPAGAHDATVTWPMIPADDPVGHYTAKFDVTNQDGTDLGCVGQSWDFN